MTEFTPSCMSLAAVAKRWDCSTGTIRGMVARGTITAFRAGTLIRIPVTEVQRIEQCPTPASSESKAETPGTSETAAVVSLRAHRAARKLSEPSRSTAKPKPAPEARSSR